MTRSTAEITYPDGAETIAARKVADQKQRVAFINATPNAVLISIHQNQYPTPQPHGAQVLYAATSDSAAFGESLHDMLVSNLDPANRRVAAPISDDIYLMKNITCPGVLVECGFLSNPEELARLQTDAYQIQLSMTMLSSYLQYYQNGCHI
jgi:N-acetylmuramoyl-L-alanine amidase